MILRSRSLMIFFFFSSRRRHTRCSRDWSSDVCSSDLEDPEDLPPSVLRTMLSGITAIRGRVGAGSGPGRGRSPWGPAEGPAAQEVPVDVQDGLAGLGTGVEDDPVTGLGDALGRRDL